MGPTSSFSSQPGGHGRAAISTHIPPRARQGIATTAAGHLPLSSMTSPALDLFSVERRGQPIAMKEPVRKRSRPFDLPEAPIFFPTEDEWKDPMSFLRKIIPQASNYGICKIVPPDSWNPDFAIDTERFHFKTRKQELNSIEGSTRANLTYLDGLSKFHKQQGSSLYRMPYVDKKPLDLYRLKKAVEARGGLDKVCKHKKWAEIGRDLGYSGKIMSSLSTSLKNSYQKWLGPYEEYLKLAKPGVHQQLEYEYGGPLTPSPAVTPIKLSCVNTPSSVRVSSPTRQASDALQVSTNGPLKDDDEDAPVFETPLAPPLPLQTSASTAISPTGPAASNTGPNSLDRSRAPAIESNSFTPPKQFATVALSAKNTPEYKPSGLAHSSRLKRQLSCDSMDSTKKDSGTDKDDLDNGSRRSKRLKKESVPTVAGSHMTLFRAAGPRLPREEGTVSGDKCEQCGRHEDGDLLIHCESCENSYHGTCLYSPPRPNSDDWNCPRCLVGDGQFGFEEGGLYSLKAFQQKAAQFKQTYFEKRMPLDPNGCPRPITEEDVETEFWRLVTDLEETVEVEYGADIHCSTHGSGFPTLEKHPNDPYSTDPWNLNNLPLHPDSLFRYIKSDISGMTVPWVYVGMTFSTFCWHNEDHYAYSANYQHFGATKTWYGIPGADAEKFEAAMKEAVPELFETQPDLLFQLVTLLTPEQLKKAGVRVYAIDQRAGQFVITLPQAYHSGFNHGFNFNEAVNFAPADWEPFGFAGVERLQAFRRQPCFSHEELLWKAAESTAGGSLSIQTARWLAPALERIQEGESARRQAFISKYLEASSHRCNLGVGGGDDPCPLTFEIDDEAIQEEEYQCYHCKAFSFFSRFKCVSSGKVLCLSHAGHHPCCDTPEEQRFVGSDHILYYRKAETAVALTCKKVRDKAQVPWLWEEKYERLLDEETTPSLRSLRNLLHEGERIPFELQSLPILREFVDRCNEWVEQATCFTVRKQQSRRKTEKGLSSRKQSTAATERREKELRTISTIYLLLDESDHIGFDCPEILQLRERLGLIEIFQRNAAKALQQIQMKSVQDIEELLEEGRIYNVDMPEIDRLFYVLEQLKWNQRAKESRGLFMTSNEVQRLIEDGKRLEVPAYNDHFAFYSDQILAGQQWERKACELMAAETIHYPQLEALSNQLQTNVLPVSQETYNAVDQILHKHREVHRQIVDLTERTANEDFRKRPKYSEICPIIKKLEELNSKPSGTAELMNELKRHEDWMRRGKKLFGKTNAPLHILKSHLDYVLERNTDCFEFIHDKPRLPAEPRSREQSPEDKAPRLEDTKFKQVFCICRKTEGGLMIECEFCREWYHTKCLKIARGKVKDSDKFTCPICDWRVTLPRDSARPKFEDLLEWQDEIQSLPFQPDEEEILKQILDDARAFRNHVAPFCNPLMSTEAESETQRFYLRKIEGAEILLAAETNFFRKELHKWCPVAVQAPPMQAISLSTRKPRPNKLQKLLAQFNVEDPDDIPDMDQRARANHLKKKRLAYEAAVAAPTSASSDSVKLSNSPTFARGFYQHTSRTSSIAAHGRLGQSRSPSVADLKEDEQMEIDPAIALHPGFFVTERDTSQLAASISIEARVLHGHTDDVNLETEVNDKAMQIIHETTETDLKRVTTIFRPDIWDTQESGSAGLMTMIPAGTTGLGAVPEDDAAVDRMFIDLTNQDVEYDGARRDGAGIEAGEERIRNPGINLDAPLENNLLLNHGGSVGSGQI